MNILFVVQKGVALSLTEAIVRFLSIIDIKIRLMDFECGRWVELAEIIIFLK
jgi:hypothetical protein